MNGNLRDYTGFSGFFDPYETPNFIFFGDDTTSAGANINFRSASIATVPEPLTILGSLTALGVGVLFKKKSKKVNR